LDLQKNYDLKTIDCSDNELTALTFNRYPYYLENVNCEKNYLNYLDISNSTELRTLNTSNNALRFLNLSKSEKINQLNAKGNISLYDICYSKLDSLNNLLIEKSTELTNNCTDTIEPYLHNKIKSKFIELGYDVNKDSKVQLFEVDKIDSLDISNSHVQYLYGLENFTNLVYLDCSNNDIYNEIDVFDLKKLKYLDCSGNYTSLINLNIDSLVYLDCSNNKINTLNLTFNPNLTYFDASKNENLKTICTWDNNYVMSKPQQFFKDEKTSYSNECNNIIQIPDSTFKKILINSEGNFDFRHIDLNRNNEIEKFEAESVRSLYLFNGNEIIYSIDGIEHFQNLIGLYLLNQKATHIDISQNTKLISFELNNYHSTIDTICVWDEEFANQNFEQHYSYVYSDKCPNSKVYIKDLDLENSLLSSGVDLNADGIIQNSEAQKVTKLDLSGKNLTNLEGIEKFTNLKTLNISDNQIVKLDLSTNLELVSLNCSNNLLTELILPNNDPSIISSNNKTTFRLMDNGSNKLVELNCSNNNLAELDLRNSTSLEKVQCKQNPLLKTICVWNISYVTNNPSFEKDNTAEWSENCLINGISDLKNEENTTIIKAFNLQGIEIPVNSKDQIMILLYSNGKREKVYKH
jgi:hypothetical protein